MIPAEPFIRRPVATSLLTAALALSGVLAFRLLPVSPLPQVDFPTIVVNASLPGASPETMASGVATPLERQFGRIAGVSEMTSSSRLGSTSVVLQFVLDRDINAAARDVQASINAARGQLPPDLPGNPTYRKVNPADAPAMILSMTSDTVPRARLYDFASSVVAQRLSQIEGVGQVNVGGGALPAVRVELNPRTLAKYDLGFDQVRTRARRRECEPSQRSGVRRDDDVRDRRDGSIDEGGRLRAVDRGVPQRRAHTPRRSRQASRTRSRTSASPVSRTANRRSSCRCSARPAPTSSRRSTA